MEARADQRDVLFPALAVEDGVYFSLCADDECRNLYAYDTDGEQRWARDDINVWDALVVGNVLYVTDFGMHVRALDAATGETRWEREREGAELAAVVDGTVYVRADDAVLALDRSDGSTRWQYETGDVRTTLHSDGVAYVVTAAGVAAVSDGRERWRTAFDGLDAGGESTIVGIGAGHLLVLAQRDVANEFRLHAFDVTTGERAWTSDVLGSGAEWDPGAAVSGDVAYVGTGTLRAFDAASGDERWSATVDEAPIRSVAVVGEEASDDNAVYVQAGETRLASFTADGEQTWEGTVDGRIRNYLVGEFVTVGTEKGIYALERSDGS